MSLKGVALITVLLLFGKSLGALRRSDDEGDTTDSSGDSWGTGPGGCKLGPNGKCQYLYDCGNGFVEGFEQCDDGNQDNGDG